jgi:thioredoxin 1
MKSTTTPLILTDDNFDPEVTDSALPVLVDFWADWCGPCHYVSPLVEQIAHDYQGRLKVGKVDVDDCPEIVTRFSVESIPTLMLFAGGVPVDQIVGAVGKDKIEAFLLEHLGEG